MTNISITDYAWAAGIIDGEGCLYIQKCKPSKGAKNNMYGARIRVAMTHFPTIQKLHNIFGGNLYGRNPQLSNVKHQFAWEMTSQKCKLVIDSIINFLFTKREEALVLDEFLKLPKATSFKETPDWLLEKREKLYKKIKELKTYNFENIVFRNNKSYKKDEITTCLVCGTEMPAFHSNGTKKTICSNKCRYENRRVLSDEEEKMLVDNYNSGEYTYIQLATKYKIKRGTIGWIIKKYASIPTIS